MQFPKRVTIELTNRCNRACAGCPRHKMTYPKGDIDNTLFTKITQQLTSNICVVPFFRGEPTLHKHFPELMSKLSRFKQVQLATNGDYLTKENQQAILNNVTFLSISLHEFKYPNQTSYLTLLYDALGRGIDTQISIVESLLPPKYKGFVKAWQKYVNRVRIYKEHSTNGFGCMNLPKTTEACSKPFEELVVYWDGKVGLCNHDWNNPFPLGDLNEQSISEVYNGSNYRSLRLIHESGLRRQIPTCRDCDFQSNTTYGELIQHGR